MDAYHHGSYYTWITDICGSVQLELAQMTQCELKLADTKTLGFLGSAFAPHVYTVYFIGQKYTQLL